MALFFHFLALLFAGSTAGAYWYGVQESLFWMYPWYDIMLHLMGGVVMGFWTCGVAARLGLHPLRASFFIFIVSVLGAGVWELFEYIVGFEAGEDYVLDTTADVINGVVGGFATAILYALMYRPHSHVE